MALADIAKATKLLVPTFQLANALPGTANWVSPFPDGSNSQTLFRLIRLSPILACTVTAHIVPPSGTPVSSNIFIPAASLTAGRVYDLYNEDDEYVAPAGYSIFIFASVAAACNCSMHGNDIGGG